MTRFVGSSYLGQDTIDRWAAIEAGQLPADDATQRPPTPDQVDEREGEHIEAIQQWGREAEAAIREAADEARAEAHQRADELEDEAAEAEDGRTRAGMMRRAAHIRDDADNEYRTAQAEMDSIADQVREQRAEVRADLQRQVQQIVDMHDERIAELQGGLDAEVRNVLMAVYFTSGQPDEIEEWHLE